MSENDGVTKFFATLGVFVVGLPVVLAFGILATMWRAWWLYPAWGWYITPLGAPQVSYWHFTAFLFIIVGFMQKINPKKDERKTDYSAMFAFWLLSSPLTWLILWWLREAA